MTVRFKIYLTVWIMTVVCSVTCGTSEAEILDVGDGWTIEITPTMKTSDQHEVTTTRSLTAPVTVETADSPPASDPPANSILVMTRTPGKNYRRIYRSIPFNRGEYNVNHSYRHDSTMEILTGNARHETIVQTGTAPIARPRLQSRVLPYRYNNPQRGLKYYFYFPYWNYRGNY